ncbi:MAG TPA: GAF domain-containing protein [Candidatus Binatia bacterium]|nr:GAF domain-containing protein [Candidatus Binatia bacterium]
MEVFAEPGDFPFRVEFSLDGLIAWWEQQAAAGQPPAAAVLEALAGAPALRGPRLEREVLERHRPVVDLLMSALFPPVTWERDLGGALPPFMLQAWYATPSLARMMADEAGWLRGRINMDRATGLNYKILHAYGAILRTFYGIAFDLDYPLVVSVDDPESGRERHFKACFDGRFTTVEAPGGPPALDEAARRRLLASLSDPAALMALLPPERFVFRGFTLFTATEVTDHEILSALQRELIQRESIVSAASFQRLQAAMRAYFGRPALRLSLSALHGDQVFLLNYDARLEAGCIFTDSAHYRRDFFAGSIYERAVLDRRPLIVEDLAGWPNPTCFESDLLKMGVRSLVVAPLPYGEETIGLLILTSDRPGDFNATHAFRLGGVLPLFAIAVKRSMDELESRIQTVIKEKCTAIHPVVEWRFRRAVLDTLERRRGAEEEPDFDLPPIVFEGVWPLYGLADVRGSSELRGRAIQADLVTQLRLARTVVEAAWTARRLPALAEVRYRIDKHLARLEAALESGDEPAVLAFLRTQVEPLFGELERFGPAVREAVAAYRGALDARLGTVYRQRRDFDESLTRLTDALSAYLDLEQSLAQSMVPHYFEKQKTDGLDYQIYAGAALLEEGRFDPLYLRSLRLWQLMVTCGLAARAERLRPALALPLETTHLVLVQHAPLAIRFRFDEKRFDVDGAYNARYEIVKKRIDKALVRGTGDRLTQPGRLVVVYSQPAEAAEYRDYIEYLQSLGYLTGDVEDLALEELPGAHGLRALRVGIDLGNPRLERRLARADLTAA